ncbi:MAG TPA: M23 family metallopeptidase [Myxococcales bacterium]|jgi:hypothetical protein
MARTHRLPALLSLALAMALARPVAAQTCYRLPFSNPDLADGWGSTCCGRTNPHRGVDFPQAAGTAIPAVAAGVVRVNTSTGCLGNVVELLHGDGMYSAYCHMLGPSPLAVGTSVAMGQTVGQVGNTGSCSQGAHLHLTMSDHESGYYTGTTVDPYAYITSHTTCAPANEPPGGWLDGAACDRVWGWAQDPDEPGKAIDVHLYFGGPAGSGAVGKPLNAGRERSDLCGAIGSCNHAYEMPSPYSLHDGQGHEVHAYGIDSQGGPNPELGASPRTLTCAADPPAGVKRHVANTEAYAAWKFDAFLDLMSISDGALDALPTAQPIPAAPVMIRADGHPEVFVVDSGFRRHVPSPEVATHWHLDLGAVQVKSPAEVEALPVAPPLRGRPSLVKGSGSAIYLVDDALPGADAGTPGPDAASSKVDSGAAALNSDAASAGADASPEPGPRTDGGSAEQTELTSGCGCSASASALSPLTLLLLLALRRRA